MKIVKVFFILSLFFLSPYSNGLDNKVNKLFEAIKNNNTKLIESVVKGGVDVNARGNFGETALMKSIYLRNNQSAEKLIYLGADVNITDIAGITPLHIAARTGNSYVVELLLKRGAKINAKDKYNMTPIMKAAGANRNHIVELLRDQGADITNKDIFGYNIFDIAEKTNNKEIKNILHEYYQSAEPINVRKEKVVVAQNQPKPVVSKRAKENENSLANKQFAEHNINETPQKAPIAKVEQEAIIDHELETERRKMIEQEANNKRKQHMQQLVEKIKTKEATKVANKDLTTPSKNEEISLDKAAPIVQPAEKIDEAKLTNPQSSKLEQLPTKNIYAEAKKMELPALNKKSNVADIKEEKTKEEMLTPNVIEAADNPVLNAFELKKEIVPKKENTIKKAKTDASNSVKNIKNSTERPVVLENIETESNNEINNTPADSNISEIAGSTYGRENKLLTPQIIEDNYYKKVSTRRSKLKIGKAQKVTTKEAKQVQLTTKSSKSNDYWLILQTGYINQGDKILHKTIDVIRDYDLKYQIIKNLVDNRQYIKVGPIKDIVEAEYYCNKTLQSPYYNKCSVRRH